MSKRYIGEVTVIVDGEKHSGDFTYREGVVTVWYRDASRSITLCTGDDPEYHARQLLHALVDIAKFDV